MSAPLRFLGLAIVGYVGLRTAASAFALTPLEEVPLPPAATPLLDAFASGEVGASPTASPVTYGTPAAIAPSAPMPPQYVPVYLPAPAGGTYLPQPRMSRPVVYAAAAPEPYYEPTAYAPAPQSVADWPAVPKGGAPAPTEVQKTPSWNGQPLTARLGRRWQLTSWAMIRPRDPTLGINDPGRGLHPSLASAGSLGGSQAGARLTYQLRDRLNVTLRTSTPLDQQTQSKAYSGEGALGMTWQPLRSVPIRLLAERRQRVGAPGGGRNAFAFMAEGGVYSRPVGWGLLLDGYGQAGMVGLRSRDLFAEGGATVSRPFLNRFAFGGGVWGGVQPGIHRLDAGPRVSYRWTPRIRVHLDYRWKLIGNASPPSGPAVTVAGDF